MAITTYAELQTAIANWTHRADLGSIAPDLITIAEKRIFREVRIRVMESNFNGIIANGVIAIPSDYLDLKFAYINATPTSMLARASASQIYSQYPNRTAGGKPRLIGREGPNFIFGPFPDSSYSVSGIYYAKPDGIASSVNALFMANPDLYLFAALCETAPYIKDDPRVQLWEAKYMSIKQQMQFEDDVEGGGGAGMSVKVA